MKNKLNLTEMAEAINYYDVQTAFYKKNGKILSDKDLLSKGLDIENDWPFNFKEFKKLGFGVSHVIYDCEEGKRNVLYLFDYKTNTITIESDKFTIKEFLIIIDMIRRHFDCVGAGQFIAFGNDNDETHTLFHEEGSVFGVWWEDFYNFYMDRINGIYTLKRIHIQTDDYETDDKRFQTKDRVIRIVFE